MQSPFTVTTEANRKCDMCSKNTAYWRLFSGRGILCSLEPLVCEWNFPAVHKNTQTASRAYLRTLEESEGEASTGKLCYLGRGTHSSVWADGYTGCYRVTSFQQTRSASCPRGLLFLHMFFCGRGFTWSVWMWLRNHRVPSTVIPHSSHGLGKAPWKH